VKRTLLCLLACAALLAQKPTPEKIESCGLGSGHHCHCIERTDKIQDKAMAVCNGPNWREFYRTKEECYSKRLAGLDHCSIAESWTEYDQGTDATSEPEMGPMCAMACKKHDCKCSDGPTCHFGHAAAEHPKGEK
jgi:hypothetical protein